MNCPICSHAMTAGGEFQVGCQIWRHNICSNCGADARLYIRGNHVGGVYKSAVNEYQTAVYCNGCGQLIRYELSARVRW